MSDLILDPKTTALVLIDLQKGIVGRDTSPHTASDIVQRAAGLADRFRKAGATVVLVHVAFSPDGRDRLQPLADVAPPAAPVGPDWSEIVPGIGPRPGDLVITKRQWGAFCGTDLDLQLRRRGVGTLVLGGIATNFGVESTARAAYELGYQQIFVEDACSSLIADEHAFAMKAIFPRIGRIRTTAEVLAALPSAGG